MPRPAEDPDGMRFTLPGEPDPIDDERLAELYAYPAGPNRCLLRANAIISLDGGRRHRRASGGLGGPGDRRLFSVLRELADVIVVGAGTARAENYSGAQMTVAARGGRQRRSQGEIPPIALVTRSGRLEHDLPVLTRTEVPPLVLTCTDAAADAGPGSGRPPRCWTAPAPTPPRSTRRRPAGARRPRPAAGAVRGRTDAAGHVRRARPARRTVPDLGADAGRRRRRGSRPAPATS